MPRSATTLGLLALLLFVAAGPATSQSLPFRTYSSDDGLAESVVLALYQDSRGFLWLGTPAGASRFDGLEFTTFDDSNGLPNDVVRDFLEDRRGDLWVATDGGLGHLQGERWTTLGPADGLPATGIRCLAEDPRGRVWAGTWGGGVVRFEGDGQPTLLDTDDGLAHDRVRACYRDQRGRMWLGTWGGGLSRWTGESFRNYATADGLGDLHVRALAEDAEGRLLVGTNMGVYRLADERFVPLAATDQTADGRSLARATVTSLHLARDGRLWLGTRDHGACHWRPGTLRCLGLGDGLADNSVNGVLEDREGNLWFATFGGGASRLSGEGMLNYSARDGLPNASVQAFVEVGDELWIGTHGGGVSRLGAKGFLETLSTAEGLPHDKVISLAADLRGGLWLGTLDGAAHLKDGVFTPYLPAQGLAHRTVLDILAEDDGTVLFGTLEGLTRRDPRGATTTFGSSAGLPGRRINHILPARGGGYWLATEGGLVRFRDGVEQIWTPDDGLSDAYVNRLLERDDGLWIATASGLDHLREGILRSYGTADGLSHEKCTVLLEDRGGRLWVGTTRGINVFDGQRFRAFSNRDGLLSSEVNPGAGLRDRQGRLWFGTVRGASVFEPDAVLRQVPPPSILLTRVVAGGTEITARRDGLTLPRPTHPLHFEFVGISLSYPEEVVYRVQLEGYDTAPRTTRSRQVEYAALAPGSYTFEARASHRGAWGEPVRFAFTIPTPFHQTLLFRGLLAVGLLALGLFVHRLRLRRIEQRNQRLEELVAERTAEVQQERHLVRRKNDLLETTNLIVQQINAELELDSLLRTILEGACFLAAADCALALVRPSSDGRPPGRRGHGAPPPPQRNLEVAVDLHWPGAPRNPPPIGEEIVERALLHGTTTLGDGLHYGEGRGRTLPELLGRCPQSYAVMTAELDGEVAGYVVVGKTRDDFDDEELEALRRLQAHVVSTFVKGRTLDTLERLNATKDEFLGMAAHDLRSPLGGVKSYTDLLLRLLDEDRLEKPLARKFLGNMRTSTEQMLTLVEDLLDVTSIETGRIELRLAPFPMAELLAEHLAFHQRAAAEKDIGLEVESIPDGVVVQVDRVRLGEVIDNLLTNAVKYTPPGGTVRVHCTVDATTVLTHVEDNGQGLRPDELPLVFTGRKLSARPTAGEKSTGLGLVIAKRLIDLHGGTLTVTSTLGQGSTFTFGLRRRNASS